MEGKRKKIQMITANPSFPDILECFTDDSVLRGQYKLLPSSSLNPQLSFVSQPTNPLLYVYTRVGTKSVYLIYCEGVPELLPGDIWETVIADALSRYAAANMAVAARRSVSDDVCKEICSEIKRLAIDVSKELVGWLIVSAGTSHMVPLARCIQRLPESPADIVQAQTTGGMPNAFWEVREAASPKESVPDWLARGLDAGWVALVTQSGFFKKDSKFALRPSSLAAPLVTKPIPLSAVKRMTSANRMPTLFESPFDVSGSYRTILSAGSFEQIGVSEFAWNLISSSSALDKLTQDAFGIESAPFTTDNGLRFITDLVPFNESGLLSVILRRIDERSLNDLSSVGFRVSLGGAHSGFKIMDCDRSDFTVVLDPRAVFATPKAPSKIERAVMLAALILTVEFVPEK